jgi:sigma-B regulation protein RsbU (phosphoserine phosphatase)
VVLFTDGVVEAKNRQGEEFGFLRLAQVVAGSSSAGEILARVLDQVGQHVGGEAQYDDLTIVTLGYTGSTDSFNIDKTQRVTARKVAVPDLP